MTCPWCLSLGPSAYPCCVPAWFWQIGVHESAERALEQARLEQIRLRLDAPRFFPPDDVEE